MATDTKDEKQDEQSANGGSDGRNVGRIEEIQGVVIEAVFTDELPEILNAITIERLDDGADHKRALVEYEPDPEEILAASCPPTSRSRSTARCSSRPRPSTARA